MKEQGRKLSCTLMSQGVLTVTIIINIKVNVLLYIKKKKNKIALADRAKIGV